MIESTDEDAEKVTVLYHLISRKIFVACEFPMYLGHSVVVSQIFPQNLKKFPWNWLTKGRYYKTTFG